MNCFFRDHAIVSAYFRAKNGKKIEKLLRSWIYRYSYVQKGTVLTDSNKHGGGCFNPLQIKMGE